MTMTRTQVGLIYERDWTIGAFQNPLNEAPWNLRAGPWRKEATHLLVATTSTSILENTADPLDESFIQAQVESASATSPALWILGRFNWNAGNYNTYGLALTELGSLFIARFDGAVQTNLISVPHGQDLSNSDATVQFYTADGIQEASVRFAGGIFTASFNDVTYNGVPGTSGYRKAATGSSTSLVSRLFQRFRNKRIVVNNVPTGCTAAVFDGAVEVDEQSEVGGVVTFNLSHSDGNTSDIPLGGYSKIEIRDSGSQVIDSVTQRIDPGDIWETDVVLDEEGPYTFEIVSGALPGGLVLDPDTGDITGTPTTAGTFQFSWIAYNNLFSTSPETCQITITSGPFMPEERPDESYHFDFGRFRNEKALIWHRHPREMLRPYLIRGKEIIYAAEEDAVDGQIIQLDKDAVAENAFWVSPCLNRISLMGELTLASLTIRYESGAQNLLTAQGSGNGGFTWHDSFSLSLVRETVGAIMRVSYGFNVTGRDVRFKILLPDDSLVRLYSWRADVIDRGFHQAD